MIEILFATKNDHKMQEIKMILADAPFQVFSMKEAGIDIDIAEDGATFEENALIKARALAEATGKIALADDSGLEVDCLNKEPGIHSARYLGENTPQSEKNAAILARMKNVPAEKRTARFVAAIAAAVPVPGEKMITLTERATLEGVVAEEAQGESGFGYDPIVWLPARHKTVAEITAEEKNKISHRGKALAQMKARLTDYFNISE